MVQIPGTQLDTNTQDRQQKIAITDLLANESLTDQNLRTFVTNLAAVHNQWSEYEKNIFNGAFPRLVRRDDANQIYSLAAGQVPGKEKGVWCKGRVIINEQAYGNDTQPVRASRANADRAMQCAYYDPGVSAAELEATRNDAENIVLDDVNDIVTAQNMLNLQHLRILLTGSQGPCRVCQLRIKRFLFDLNSVARNAHCQIPLIFQANYTTVFQPNVDQGGIQTQYGYQNASTVTIATGQPDAYIFWSKEFTCTLGASSDNAFQGLLTAGKM